VFRKVGGPPIHADIVSGSALRLDRDLHLEAGIPAPPLTLEPDPPDRARKRPVLVDPDAAGAAGKAKPFAIEADLLEGIEQLVHLKSQRCMIGIRMVPVSGVSGDGVQLKSSSLGGSCFAR
jgi:hypothetical protein